MLLITEALKLFLCIDEYFLIILFYIVVLLK